MLLLVLIYNLVEKTPPRVSKNPHSDEILLHFRLWQKHSDKNSCKMLFNVLFAQSITFNKWKIASELALSQTYVL